MFSKIKGIVKNPYTLSILSKMFGVLIGFLFTIFQSRYLGAEIKGQVATVNSIEGIKACVENGLGVSVLSLSAAKKEMEDPNADMLVFELEGVDLEREFYMVYNKNTTLSPAAAKFRDYVVERYISRR